MIKASPEIQPLTVGTSKSASDSFAAAPAAIPSEWGAIVRYNTDFQATPKLSLVGTPEGGSLPVEGHVVYKLQEGRIVKNTEVHVAGGVPFPVAGSPLGMGADWTVGGQVMPDVTLGLGMGNTQAGLFWSGDEVGLEAKWMGSGVEVGVGYSGAGDHFVVTSGSKYNHWGAERLAQLYLDRTDALYAGIYYYPDYNSALQAMLRFAILHQRQTDFPPDWYATGD
jgi:hypothetical protein